MAATPAALSNDIPAGFPLCEDLLDFFENGTLALRWVASDGTILRANRADLALAGYAPEEYVGRNIKEFHASPDGIEQMLSRVANGEVLRDWPASLVTRDGTLHDVLVDCCPYIKDGELRHVRCVTRGAVTRVTNAEEIRALNEELSNALTALEAVLAVVPVGIGIARDPECRDIRVNPAFAEQLGIAAEVNASKTGDTAEHLPFRVFQNGQEVTGENLIMQRAARERTTLRELEYDVVHDDGRVVRLLEYAAPLLDVAGSVRGAVGAFVDISERRRHELERERLLAAERSAREEAEAARGEAERARELAEAANRANSEFLAMMSHELRTPLNAIGGYIQLLDMGLRGPLTPEQRQDLIRVQTNQRHLTGLIDQVLSFARLERGTVLYELGHQQLTEALAALQPLIAPQLRAKQLTLRVEGPDPGLIVLADRAKLIQILLNLLSNAAKYTNATGTIAIACETSGSDVLIHVRDSGPGIPEDKLDLIFEPFMQVDTRLTRTEHGIGLGLAISRELARGMGGDLTVESVVGSGSTFTLRLPQPSPS
jgi:PAS domain S-box-containing protein